VELLELVAALTSDEAVAAPPDEAAVCWAVFFEEASARSWA